MIRTLLEELIGVDEDLNQFRPSDIVGREDARARNKLRAKQRQRIPEIEGKIRALMPEKKTDDIDWESPLVSATPRMRGYGLGFDEGYNQALEDVIKALGLGGTDSV